MMLYVYAITDMPDKPLSSALGLCEASPAAVGLRDITAVVSPISMDEIAQTEENLWRHEQVLEAPMAPAAVCLFRGAIKGAGPLPRKHTPNPSSTVR